MEESNPCLIKQFSPLSKVHKFISPKLPRGTIYSAQLNDIWMVGICTKVTTTTQFKIHWMLPPVLADIMSLKYINCNE